MTKENKKKVIAFSIFALVAMSVAAWLSFKSWNDDSVLDYKNLYKISETPEVAVFADYERTTDKTEQFVSLYNQVVEFNKKNFNVEYSKQIAVILLQWNKRNEKFFKNRGASTFTDIENNKIVMLDYSTAPQEILAESGTPSELLYKDLFVHHMEHLVLRNTFIKLNRIQEEGFCMSLPLILLQKDEKSYTPDDKNLFYPVLEKFDPQALKNLINDDDLTHKNASMVLFYFINKKYPQYLRELLEVSTVYSFLDTHPKVNSDFFNWKNSLKEKQIN